jgi:hypothetical protein
MRNAPQLGFKNGGQFKAATHARMIKAAGGFQWTADEKMQIARESLAILAKDDRMSRVEAMRLAVKRLPVPRRQAVDDLLAHDWIIHLWDTLAAEHDAPTPENVPTPEPQTALGLALAQAEQDATPAKASPADAAARARAAKAAKIAAGEYKLIRWTPAEQRLIALEFMRARVGFTAEEQGKRYFLHKVLGPAIEAALPPERQRKLENGTQGVRKWLEPLVAEIEAEQAAALAEQEKLDAEQAAREAAELAEREAAVMAETAAREAEAARQAEQERMRAEHEAEARMRADVQAQLDEERARAARVQEAAVAEFKAGATLEDALGMFARRFAQALFAPMVEEFKKALAGEMQAVVGSVGSKIAEATAGLKIVDTGGHSYIKPPAAPERVRVPKVFVYGMPDIMTQHIEPMVKEFEGRLELSFAHADDLGPASRKAAFADMCVICVDYVSHSGANNVRAAAKQWTKVPGGVSAIKRWLTMYEEGRVGSGSPTIN